MITNENIKKIVEDCNFAGYTIKVKDIAFVLLCERFFDVNVAFKIAIKSDFTEDEVKRYNNSQTISFLRRYINSNYKENVTEGIKTTNRKKNKVEGDITFEENKSEMIKLIKQADEKYASGEIEAKDHLKIVSELRVKLNDKFKVQDDIKDSVVEIVQKYDDICPYCRREIARRPLSKEQAMKEYNLIEKQ